MRPRLFDETALIMKDGRARVRSSTDARRTTVKNGSSCEAAIQQTKSRRGESASVPYRSKWESNYANRLDLELRAGAIKGWKYEPFSLTLTLIEDAQGKRKRVRYRPDFMVWSEAGIELVEIKGKGFKNQRDGLTRLYWAAKEYPMFIWRKVWWQDGGWDGMYV